MAVWSSRCCLTSLPGCRGGTSACSDYKGCSMQLTRYVSMPGARWCALATCAFPDPCMWYMAAL